MIIIMLTVHINVSYTYHLILYLNFTAAEIDVHKLRNALEILSETEKQLKTTKNQSTWLTAALLQFNMREPYCLDDAAVSSMFTESQTGKWHSLLHMVLH
jgi:DNA polymerase III gamma/tau subunit